MFCPPFSFGRLCRAALVIAALVCELSSAGRVRTILSRRRVASGSQSQRHGLRARVRATATTAAMTAEHTFARRHRERTFPADEDPQLLSTLDHMNHEIVSRLEGLEVGDGGGGGGGGSGGGGGGDGESAAAAVRFSRVGAQAGAQAGTQEGASLAGTPAGANLVRFAKDVFHTKDEYPFPYWSPTGRKNGEAINHGSGVCIMAILPWIHMKKNSLNPSAQTAVMEGLNKVIGDKSFLTIRNECIIDDQCDAVQPMICMGPAQHGLSFKPFCFRGYGDNACACGVAADHIMHAEYCNFKKKSGKFGGPYPPAWMIDYSDKDEYTQILADVNKKPLRINGPLPDDKIYQLVDHFIPFVGDWNPSDDHRKFPMWNGAYDSDKKGKNWEFCITGFLPYVKCTRLWSTSVSQFFTEGKISCTKDEDCYCRNGCSGPLYAGPQFARWMPICYTRGFNTCICALVSQIPTEKTCKHPTKHSHVILGEDAKGPLKDSVTGSKRYMDIYYGGDEEQESPNPNTVGVQSYDHNSLLPGKSDDGDD